MLFPASLTHRTRPKCKAAHGWNLDPRICFGGYPGAAGLAGDESQWKRHVSDALGETVLSREVFPLPKVNQPAILEIFLSLGALYLDVLASPLTR